MGTIKSIFLFIVDAWLLFFIFIPIILISIAIFINGIKEKSIIMILGGVVGITFNLGLIIYIWG